MSPDNQVGYYRPFEAIERFITQKAELAREFPQQMGIDGLSVVGKGTLAMRLADLLHVHYFNTGLLYRAITVAVQQENIPVLQLSDSQLTDVLQDINISYPGNDGASHIDIETIHLPMQDITHLTQTATVEKAISAIAGRIPTRTKVEALQQKFLQDNPFCIMEGRNMREVMKDIPAENKFLMYVFASPDELAKRLQGRRHEAFDEAKDSVLSRIRSDYNREHGRVYPPYEAITSQEYNLTIDSTHMLHPEVVVTTLDAYIKKGKAQGFVFPLPTEIMKSPVK